MMEAVGKHGPNLEGPTPHELVTKISPKGGGREEDWVIPLYRDLQDPRV